MHQATVAGSDLLSWERRAASAIPSCSEKHHPDQRLGNPVPCRFAFPKEQSRAGKYGSFLIHTEVRQILEERAVETSGKCFFSVLCELLDSETRCRILAKDLARADIAPQSRNRLVPRLAHNDELADAIHRRLGDASGAEGVAAELLRLQSGSRGCTLEELADRVSV